MQMFQLRSVLAAKRLKVLFALFFKYGFGELSTILGFRPKFFCRRDNCEASHNLTVWERIRNIIEDMGPTTIKIGQILSMRPDLVPPELCEALVDLQEDVYQEKYEDIVDVVESSYNCTLHKKFRSFEKEPIAAASLSQVHKAVLHDGTVVAVKVRRPQVMETILADLEIMRFMATRLHERVAALKSMNVPEVVAEIQRNLLRELDFRNEARNIIMFNNYFRDDPHIMAPKVFADMTTEEVLVMEYVKGVRVDDFKADDATRKALAEKGLEAVVQQLLEHGFFHADPHMGNLKILNGDTLCYMDWGMAGFFTPSQRSALIDYVQAIVDNDSTKVTKVALKMAKSVPPRLDEERFHSDVMFIMSGVRTPLKGYVNLGRFLLDLTTLCRSYDIALRSDYILMARALLATEAAGRAIYPQFNAMESLAPIARKWMLKRYSVIFSDKPLLTESKEVIGHLLSIPERLDTVLSIVENGHFAVELKQAEHSNMMVNLRRISNRVSMALISASLVIGSSLLLMSDAGPLWGGVSILGIIGFVLSGLFSVWLVAHMMMRGE